MEYFLKLKLLQLFLRCKLLTFQGIVVVELKNTLHAIEADLES